MDRWMESFKSQMRIRGRSLRFFGLFFVILDMGLFLLLSSFCQILDREVPLLVLAGMLVVFAVICWKTAAIRWKATSIREDQL